MTDFPNLLSLVHDELEDIAKQAAQLGVGLQNVAPGEKGGAPNLSIQYLLETADNLRQFAEESNRLLNNS